MGWFERAVAVAAGAAIMSISVALSVVGGDAEQPHTGRAAAVSAAPAPPPIAAPRPEVVPAVPKPVVRSAVTKPRQIGAVTTIVDTVLRTKPWLHSRSIGPVPAGILSPVVDQRWGFYKVLTPNENVGWLHKATVTVHEKATSAPRRLENATIVIDPGHGGREPGAIGPGGFTEKDANLAISRAVVANLKGGRVFLTRNERYAGLAYRAGLANRLGAVAFVSVHNNASPVRTNSKLPGAEVYHRVDHAASARLAGLIHGEIVQVLKRFEIGWGRNPVSGPKYRRSHQHGGDYYGVLRNARVPAVIVENMFISNQREEKLLRRADVRALLGAAIGRGIERFIETAP
jgi:N-acetylmuramoyl-L-alanine amidase